MWPFSIIKEKDETIHQYKLLVQEQKDFIKNLTSELEKETKLSSSFQKKIKNIEEENRARWQPLLAQLMKLSAAKNPSNGYKLSIIFDDISINAVASYNSNLYWDYFCEQVSYGLKRQLATLNFSGLYKMAEEAEAKKYRLAQYGFTPGKGWE